MPQKSFLTQCIAFLARVFTCTFLCIGPCSNSLDAQPTSAQSSRSSNVQLSLRETADCPSNLLLLSDVAELNGIDSLVQPMAGMTIAPAPRMGSPQMWSRESIEKALNLRGVTSDSIQWKGASQCRVQRVDGHRFVRKDIVASSEPLGPPNSAAQSASYQTPNAKPENPIPIQNPIGNSIDRSTFTTPFTTPATMSQAERIAIEAISSYLQTKSKSTGRWDIKVQISSEHAKTISLRRQILGVAGGTPPWEGDQEFLFLIKGPSGEQSVTVNAVVTLPKMVVAANRPLSKGYILKEDDLDWIAFPRGLQYGTEDCFGSIDELVGQQLRRAMSTQQVIRLTEVGSPTIVYTGDIVELEVISGDVIVETKGRAIESGSMDDLIQLEIEGSRTRVLARVNGNRKAEVLSSGVSKPSQKNTYNPNSPKIKR